VFRRETDLLYERLGYSENDQHDYWFWGKAIAQNRQSTFSFQDDFGGFPDMNIDSNWMTLRVNMVALTGGDKCGTDHKAVYLVTKIWLNNLGRTERATFTKDFMSRDSIEFIQR
jgi:hypothetical protein